MYDWINNYRNVDLDGIRNRRKNEVRRSAISTYKNKETIKLDIVIDKSPKMFAI